MNVKLLKEIYLFQENTNLCAGLVYPSKGKLQRGKRFNFRL